MTMFKRGDVWWYEFWFRKRRYRASTHQLDWESAAQVERDAKTKVRREARGLIPVDRMSSPSFSAWAQTFVVEKRKTLTRPDVLERTLRSVLAFWGAKPKKPVKGGVYHNLRLLDPILDSRWIDRFEAWMAVRPLSGSAKNSYRSCVSGMYRLALRPRYRQRTHVQINPMTDVGRDARTPRTVHLTIEELRAWITAAAPHARLALTIGALAPKLRLAQVLALRFDQHLDRDLTRIIFEAHKTRRHTQQPQVTPISSDLRLVLRAVRDTQPESRYVVTWRGEPVKSIKRAVKSAATDVGLAWGVKGGVTFHALRHVFGTEAARLGIAETLASQTLGHKDPRTTRQHYTHLVSADEIAVVDQLATHLGIAVDTADAVVKTVGTRRKTAERPRATRDASRATRKRAAKAQVIEP